MKKRFLGMVSALMATVMLAGCGAKADVQNNVQSGAAQTQAVNKNVKGNISVQGVQTR